MEFIGFLFKDSIFFCILESLLQQKLRNTEKVFCLTVRIFEEEKKNQNTHCINSIK